ncbi:hypothetical protein Q0590_26480 [Rhodocytophaga aerolata]|uniref:Uncharacterized protein n=1 Tax=Rhodocytophaga aerolata TaxID=455078 RepID=A0ABT8RCW7_9BACT|nr:hypothetical protein [Rhodocytophaga aerolata]MDO1449854.1 hypothetical protein [Rhodocytophaga aerolata]
MGNGDYKTTSNAWRMFTVFLLFTGFMFITTAVTYMLPILSADVFKKKVSKKIYLLGRDPQEILLNHWQKGSFKRLESNFSDLSDMILTHRQQLLAYPILYSFHNSHPQNSSSLSIAAPDEALTILLVHVPEENRPSNQVIGHLRKVIASFLNVLDKNFIKKTKTEISLPQIERLQEAGIPLIKEDHQIRESYKKISRRRHLIGIMLNNEGWNFSDIYQSDLDYELEI